MRTLVRSAAAFLVGAVLTALVFAFHPEPGEAIRNIAHAPPGEPQRPNLYNIVRVKRDDGGFDHFLGPHVSIDPKNVDGGYAPHTTPAVRLLIDVEGRVAYAEARFGPKTLQREAERLARQVRFIPFRRNGQPVAAVIEEFEIHVRGPGNRPDYPTPFPPTKDMATFEFTMSYAGGFGGGTQYQVSILGDGTIRFESDAYGAAVAGKHEAKLSEEQVQKIVEALQRADWLWTPDEYQSRATDQPRVITTLRFDGRIKFLSFNPNHYGYQPNAIRDAYAAVLRVANADRWLRGNSETGPSLVAEKWNFKSATSENKSLLGGIAARGTLRALQDVWALGAPVLPDLTDQYFITPPIIAAASRDDPQILDFLLSLDTQWGKKALGAALVEAASNGNAQGAVSLLYKGANPRAKGRLEGTSALMAAASAGSPKIVAELIEAASNPKSTEWYLYGTTDESPQAAERIAREAKAFVNERDKDGRTALHAIGSIWAPRSSRTKSDPRAVVKLLLKHGAIVDARDKDGRTPLMRAGSQPHAASELISAGADVNAKDNRGETPLMNSYAAWLTLLLLEHGADVYARDKEGRTALDHSKQYGGNDTAPVLEWWLAKENALR